MRNSLLCLAVAIPAAALAFSAAAQAAEDGPGQYIAVSALYHLPADSDFTSYPENNVDVAGSIAHEPGFGLLAAYGRRITGGFGFEFEVAYRKLESKSIRHKATDAFTAEGPIPVSVDSSAITAMANVVYTESTLIDSVKPFVGAGVGVMWSRRDAFAYKAKSQANHPLLRGTVYRISQPDDSAGAFVWQAMAGARIPVSDTFEARLGYRYLRSGTVDYGDVETRFATHTFELGLLARF